MKKSDSFFKRPVVWFFLTLSCFLFAWMAFHFYPQAFPSVNLKIKMNRTGAMKSAFELASQYHWGPKKFKQAVSFNSDSLTQTYVELSQGGNKVFNEIVSEGIYAPYTWQVRHFAEGSAHETWISFTPQGKFYGFQESLPEHVSGAALSQEKALKIAETSAKKHWGLQLKDYTLIEKSFEVRLSSRIDHTFVYERKNKQIGEGKYRLKLTVDGDQLSGLSHFIKIPESFIRKYSEMRSFNSLLSQSATVVMFVLYLFVGCCVGLFFLAKKRWVIWKMPLICAGVVAFIQFLEVLNQFPLLWMNYDTAVSSSSFIMNTITRGIVQFVSEIILLTLSFMAAESISRKAFPSHPLLWNIWKPQVASSYEILGRTLGGYLGLGFFMALVVMTYYIGRHFLGWWNPSDILFHPDSLATFFPWFTSISHSLHAGFWEEALFRAIPLGGAALLGARFGRKNLWITGAFLLQAIVFAAAHANYATQPFYARLIELILPSFVFGGIYLAFGLLPGILLHFIFDVAAFSIPIFTADTPSIWIAQSLTILISLTPLWIVLFSRWKVGKWNSLKSSQLNRGWLPEKLEAPKKEVVQKPPRFSFSKKRQISLVLYASIAFGLWVYLVKNEVHVPSLSISKQNATQIAQAALKNEGYTLSPEWEMYSFASWRPQLSHDFIWKNENKNLYSQLFGNYLTPPTWNFRWIRFDREVAERSEEYQVHISENGTVYQVSQTLPEARPGSSVSELQARQIALKKIHEKFSFLEKDLKDVSIHSSQNPSRKDWVVQFSDPSISLKSGEARVAASLYGNHPSSLMKFLHLPEEWLRQERNQKAMLSSLSSFASLLIFCCGVFSLIYSVYRWIQGQFDKKVFFISVGTFFILGLFNLYNQSPAWMFHLSTSQPKINQLLSHFGWALLKIMALALGSSLGLGVLFYEATNSVQVPKKPAWMIGLSSGILSTCLSASLYHLFPHEIPFLGDLSPLNLRIPALTFLIEIPSFLLKILIFFFLSFFLNKITHRWSKRRGLGVTLILLLGLSIAALGVTSIVPWLIGGAFLSLSFFLFYYFILNSAYSISVIIAFSWIFVSDLKNILKGTFPDTHLPFFIEMMALGCLTFFLFESLRKKAEYKISKNHANS